MTTIVADSVVPVRDYLALDACQIAQFSGVAAVDRAERLLITSLRLDTRQVLALQRVYASLQLCSCGVREVATGLIQGPRNIGRVRRAHIAQAAMWMHLALHDQRAANGKLDAVLSDLRAVSGIGTGRER